MARSALEQDFDAILRDTHPQIRAYIAGMGIAAHDVDDVAQEVYLEFYKNQEKVPDGVVAVRWLKGIARNLCLNHIRRCSRRGRLHQEALAELLARTETRLDQGPVTLEPVQVALESCVQKLPSRSRQLLTMKYEEDMSSQSMAEALGSTAEAVRVALFRVRAVLKNCIDGTLDQEHS